MRRARWGGDRIGVETVWVEKEDDLKILSPEVKLGVRWQLEYARLFRRITDNSKVLALTGLTQIPESTQSLIKKGMDIL